MKSIYLITLILLAQIGFAQDESSKGMFSFGMRNTTSFFNSDGEVGSGIGGQFRIQMSDEVNTEWYADYITSSDNEIGRTDYHIGWSVQYYFLKNNRSPSKVLQPFFEAGHCFDRTQLNVYNYGGILNNKQTADRWSSAVQMGAGTLFNITPSFDCTLKFQYMLHLGKELHVENVDDVVGGAGYLPNYQFTSTHGASLEGHLLMTVSINYKLGKLWGKG